MQHTYYCVVYGCLCFKQKTAYELRISDWSSYVCSSDLCASDYSEALARHAGTPPVLDVAQLGLGADGHTASLVPGDPLLDLTDAEVGVSGPYQGDRESVV